MKPDMFRQPVPILVGLGFPAEVRSVMDAYRHLAEWPASLKDTAHSVALKACTAALIACAPKRKSTRRWRMSLTVR